MRVPFPGKSLIILFQGKIKWRAALLILWHTQEGRGTSEKQMLLNTLNFGNDK